MTPSQRLRAHLLAQMKRHEPFSRLEPASMEALLTGVRESYHAPGELILGPEGGVVRHLRWVRSGVVRGTGSGGEVFEVEAGDVFPVGAVLAERAVTSRYEALDDVFCLEIDASVLRETARRDPILADFLQRRMRHLLTLAAHATQVATASQVLAQQSFEAPLSTLVGREPVSVGPDAPLLEGLQLMRRERVGSVVVADEGGRPVGILTQQDLLARVVLPEHAPDLRATAMREVMSAPVFTLDEHARVSDAVLAMSGHGIRHVPLTRAGRLVGVVSERDLFALQKQSLGGLGAALRGARDTAALQALAPQVRAYARRLQAQGVGAPTLTSLVSHLNDLLCKRLVQLEAGSHELDLRRACWVAFGSEGRGEQTVATDQDNGLVLADGVDEPERERWLAFGKRVNEALDACGFPLCKGAIMAGQPRCCLRQGQWHARFEHWMHRGDPQDLLEASIFFDMRPVAGNGALVTPLRQAVTKQAPQHPRFLRLLAENSLRLQPALAWHGGLETESDGGRRHVDLKLHGTAVFVDAARLFALAAGVQALGTRERLVQAGATLGVPEHEREGWASAFEVLQMLRLRAQVQAADGQATNRVDIDSLDDIDRQLLREAMKVARRLQQRLSLDWLRT
jgi:CBS domain-containing protein